MLLQEVGAAFFLFLIQLKQKTKYILCSMLAVVNNNKSFEVGCRDAKCPAAYDISIIENSVFNITTPSHLSLKVQTYQNNFFGYCTSNLQHFQQSLPAQDLDECKPSVA